MREKGSTGCIGEGIKGKYETNMIAHNILRIGTLR